MITDSLTNKVYFSSLLPKRAPKTFHELKMVLNKYDVAYDELQNTNDIWCRDYMPIQISENNFAGYNYNPDYLQDSEEDRKTITDGNEVCRGLGLKVTENQNYLVIDGGNVIKCDGRVIMTEKVVVENQAAYSRPVLKTALEKHFNAEVIFLPWDRCEYFGHADGLVRYIGNDRVLITHYRQYSSTFVDKVTKILKEYFSEVYELRFPLILEHQYSWAYINWLQTSQVLIIPKFGYVEDAMALQQIKKLMPEYEDRIEQIDARDLIIDGGCLNCATWNVYCKEQAEVVKDLNLIVKAL